MKFTADSIPDEEIDALWREACGTGLSDVNPDLMHLCTVAVNRKEDFTATEQQHARIAIALLLNRRTTAPSGAELTADTITDDQIRELRRRHTDASTWWLREYAIALGEVVTVNHPAEDRREARQRCAEVLNARSGT